MGGCMKKSMWVIFFLLLALLGSGCKKAIAVDTIVEKSLSTAVEDKQGMDSVKNCISSTRLENLEGNSVESVLGGYEQKLDKFLICLVGPDVTDDSMVIKAEVKQLRAHIISTVIARYAAFNLDGKMGQEFIVPLIAYDERIDDAEDSLLSIVKVERPIRARSGLFSDLSPPDYSEFDPVPSVQRNIESYGRLYRVLHFVDAIKEAGTPTARRARKLMRGVIGAVMSGSISGLRSSLKSVTMALGKLYLVKDLAGSYRGDISAYLSCVQSRESGEKMDGICGNSLKEDWKTWDKLLAGACLRLKSVADIEVSCTPGSYK